MGPPAQKTAIGRTHQEDFNEAHAHKRHNEYDREGKNAKVSLELDEQGLLALLSFSSFLQLNWIWLFLPRPADREADWLLAHIYHH